MAYAEYLRQRAKWCSRLAQEQITDDLAADLGSLAREYEERAQELQASDQELPCSRH